MTNATDERTSGQSPAEQVKERVQEVAGQAKGQSREQLRAQINQRSTQAGEQVSSAATAMRRTGENLRGEGSDGVAKVLDGLAERGEQLGSYLSRADGDQILRDVEDVARKQPWLFVGGTAIVGFLASRFMKASSNTRYQGAGSTDAYPYSGREGDASVGYISPAAPPPLIESPDASPLTGGASGGSNGL
ncbi:MAG: hypothetical protein H0X39_14000 [Actinobacteria bacterium]|nr:hypothetical protein [Actinomycetota bacterium]